MSGPNDNQPNRPGETGLSILDLENLPRAQYRVMRMVMRDGDCTYSRLCSALEAEGMVRAEIDKTLDELIALHWLIKNNDHYRTNLRKKSTRTLSDFQPPRRGTSTLRGIWDSLESGDDKNKDKK